MKNLPKAIASILLASVLALALMPISAFAVERTPTTEFTVNTYKIYNYKAEPHDPSESPVNNRKITKGDTLDFVLEIWRNSNDVDDVQIVHGIDSFNAGVNAPAPTQNSHDTVANVYTIELKDLIYSGSGNKLEFTIMTPTKYQTITLNISQCEDYVEPIPDAPIEWTPNPTPMPRAVYSTNETTELIAPDTNAVITVHIQNTGSTAMQNPILNISASEALILTGGQISYPLLDIVPGKRVDVEIPVRTTKTIMNQTQSIDLELSFDFLTAGQLERGQSGGKVLVPVQLSQEPEKEPDKDTDTKIDKPVPLIILSDYSYGGEPIAAGSEAELVFTFKNTSKLLATENIMLTVSMPSDIRFNGATNTYYFESMAPGTSRTLTIPVLVNQVVSSNTGDVHLAFKYEYVDDKSRRENAIDLAVSIPLFQPDRLEFGDPVIPYVGMVGEEISVTLEYVNKGRSAISNMEAEISGDLYSYNSYQRIGNVESGKSGTIAFAFTPTEEGDNNVVIRVSYEDANGNLKEKTFELTVSPTPWEDPGQWVEPDIPPEPEKKPFPWWIVGAAAGLILVILAIVLAKKKKKAKAEAERKMLESLDDEDDLK